jgi:hypothetical protein
MTSDRLTDWISPAVHVTVATAQRIRGAANVIIH